MSGLYSEKAPPLGSQPVPDHRGQRGTTVGRHRSVMIKILKAGFVGMAVVLCLAVATSCSSRRVSARWLEHPEDPGAQSWERLGEKCQGERIRIERHDGSLFEGTCTSVGRDFISVQTKTGKRVFPRSHVNRVQVYKASPRARGASVGAGIGAAVLLILAAALEGDAGESMLVMSPVSAAVGAAVGLAVSGGKEWKTIYPQQ